MLRYDVFTDNPIPLIYQALDKEYSQSKFIHTVRDEQAWLESVRWFFTTGSRKFRRNKKPVINQIHQGLYGTTVFDPEIFMERYRQHNQEVIDYFSDRPDKLLVFNLTEGDGYEKLCPFLGVVMPEYGFPARNKSENVLKVLIKRFIGRY